MGKATEVLVNHCLYIDQNMALPKSHGLPEQMILDPCHLSIKFNISKTCIVCCHQSNIFNGSFLFGKNFSVNTYPTMLLEILETALHHNHECQRDFHHAMHIEKDN